MYADVIIDITHEKVDKVFQYEIPEVLDSVEGCDSVRADGNRFHCFGFLIYQLAVRIRIIKTEEILQE